MARADFFAIPTANVPELLAQWRYYPTRKFHPKNKARPFFHEPSTTSKEK